VSAAGEADRRDDVLHDADAAAVRPLARQSHHQSGM